MPCVTGVSEGLMHAHPLGARTRSAGHAAEGKRGCPHSRSRATSPNEFSLHAAVLSPHTIPSVLTLFNTSENPRPPPPRTQHTPRWDIMQCPQPSPWQLAPPRSFEFRGWVAGRERVTSGAGSATPTGHSGAVHPPPAPPPLPFPPTPSHTCTPPPTLTPHASLTLTCNTRPHLSSVQIQLL